MAKKIRIGILLAALVAAAGYYVVVKFQSTAHIEQTSEKTGEGPAAPDPRLVRARALIQEAKGRLIQEGRYTCCCTDPCTLCLLERGTCTCQRDATKPKNPTTCSECLPRLPKKVDEAGNPEGPDLRSALLRKEKVLAGALQPLPSRERGDLEFQPGVRDVESPAWLSLQEPEFREAVKLLQEARLDLKARTPPLYECCCGVGCVSCLQTQGSCGCLHTMQKPPERPPAAGGRAPTACAECVRTWQLHPAQGQATWQPEKSKRDRVKPTFKDLRADPPGVPHPDAPR